MISGKNMILLLKRTLNLVSPKIMDHGERVAYIVSQMLNIEGGHSMQELIDVCFLCIIHDVGAYKTEELDSIMSKDITNGFETKNTVKHAVYGYLFVDAFSPISEYADAILYHHSSYDKLLSTDCKNKSLASKIFVADRLDIELKNNNIQIDNNLFSEFRDTVFCGNDIDLLISLGKQEDIAQRLKDGSYIDNLNKIYDKIEMTDSQVLSFLRTAVYAIDFRSEFTVMHTITTAGLSIAIAKLMNIADEVVDKIFYASLLHDIGKIAIPLEILEKNGRLTDDEFEIMKQHITIGENILSGLIDDEIFNIAMRHHEKLNGTGYPHGLPGKNMSQNERIVCIADIISALSGRRSYKEPFDENEIKSILKTISEKGEVDSDIIKLVLDNYSDIMKTVHDKCAWALEKYRCISQEYQRIYANFIE